jgi:hypothetical protein
MHPKTFSAFSDELEKIAVTPGWVQKKTIGALQSNQFGHRPLNPDVWMSGNTLGRIQDRVAQRRVATPWTQPVRKAQWAYAGSQIGKADVARSDIQRSKSIVGSSPVQFEASAIARAKREHGVEQARAAVARRPATTSTAPAYQSPITTMTMPQRPPMAPTPAAPVQRRPFSSFTPPAPTFGARA